MKNLGGKAQEEAMFLESGYSRKIPVAKVRPRRIYLLLPVHGSRPVVAI